MVQFINEIPNTGSHSFDCFVDSVSLVAETLISFGNKIIHVMAETSNTPNVTTTNVPYELRIIEGLK